MGLIGLGAMGSGMAGSLRARGHTLRVCDARPGIAAAFAAAGGTACADPAETAAGCSVVVSVVVNAQQTDEVLFGPRGCAAVMAPGSVFVMCSTVDPAWSAALADRLDERGLLSPQTQLTQLPLDEQQLIGNLGNACIHQELT